MSRDAPDVLYVLRARVDTGWRSGRQLRKDRMAIQRAIEEIERLRDRGARLHALLARAAEFRCDEYPARCEVYCLGGELRDEILEALIGSPAKGALAASSPGTARSDRDLTQQTKGAPT